MVWLSTTADVLDDAQQSAFERYVQTARLTQHLLGGLRWAAGVAPE